MASVLLSSRLCPHSLTHTVLHPKEPRAHCISVRSDRYCENCTSQQPEQCGLWHVGPCSPANRCTTAQLICCRCRLMLSQDTTRPQNFREINGTNKERVCVFCVTTCKNISFLRVILLLHLLSISLANVWGQFKEEQNINQRRCGSWFWKVTIYIQFPLQCRFNCSTWGLRTTQFSVANSKAKGVL